MCVTVVGLSLATRLADLHEIGRFTRLDHAPDVVVVGRLGTNPSLNGSQCQHVPTSRSLVEFDQNISNGIPRSLIEAFRHCNRLDRGWAHGIDDLATVAELGLVAHLDGENLGIDRRGVHSAVGDHPNRLFVKPRVDDLREKPVYLTDRHHVIPGDAVAGLRQRIVEGPGSVAKVHK